LVFLVRIQLDDIIAEIGLLLKDSRSIRGRVLLGKALEALKEYKQANEKKLV
jgi:hypothetical protein